MLHSAGKTLQRPRRFQANEDGEAARQMCGNCTQSQPVFNYNVEQCNCGRHNVNLSSEANFCNAK